MMWKTIVKEGNMFGCVIRRLKTMLSYTWLGLTATSIDAVGDVKANRGQPSGRAPKALTSAISHFYESALASCAVLKNPAKLHPGIMPHPIVRFEGVLCDAYYACHAQCLVVVIAGN